MQVDYFRVPREAVERFMHRPWSELSAEAAAKGWPSMKDGVVLSRLKEFTKNVNLAGCYPSQGEALVYEGRPGVLHLCI